MARAAPIQASGLRARVAFRARLVTIDPAIRIMLLAALAPSPTAVVRDRSTLYRPLAIT